MSETAWSPVSNTLSSAGPQPTLTLDNEKKLFSYEELFIYIERTYNLHFIE